MSRGHSGAKNCLDRGTPPLEELNTVSQKKHVWFTDGSAMVVKGKSSVKYAANNLKEEIIQGLLDPPNILSPL